MGNCEIIIFGKHYMPALGSIRSLGEAGHSIIFVFISNKKGKKNEAAVSKYVSKYIELVIQDDRELKDFFVGFLPKVSSQTILFPIDDYAVAFLGTYRSELADYWFPHADGDYDVLQLMNKDVQRDIAQKVGLKSAKEIVVNLSETIELESIDYPCFCKPLISIKGSKQEMRRCNNERELSDALQSMKEYQINRSILIQDFLDIKEEIDISGYSLNGDIQIAGVIKKLSVAKYNKGPTALGMILDNEKIQFISEKLIAFMKTTSYNGIFDIEMFLCEDGIYFNELNLRPTGVIYALTKAGNNIPQSFISLVSHQAADLYYAHPINKSVFISEKVVDEDYLFGYISGKEKRKMYKQADYGLIRSSEDIKPYLVYKINTMKRAIKKKVKEILRQENRSGRKA